MCACHTKFAIVNLEKEWCATTSSYRDTDYGIVW